MMQYVPDNNVYTYFRYDGKQTIMIVMNTGNDSKTIQTDKFSERTNGFTKARNIINGSINNLNEPWEIPAKTSWVLELMK
jgi:hypothetical protein